MTDNQANPRSFWPRRISWLTIVLTLLAVVTFLAIFGSGMQYAIPMGTGGGVMENSGSRGEAVPPTAPSVPMMDTSVSSAPAQGKVDSNMYYPYPYPNPNVPVTDTREFLKVYYNASMRTRDVQGLTRRVETTVRGYAGRIDQESSSPQYGFVSFAVPQSKYDAFRAELEGLVSSRFLTINISSQNLLPQKISIEEQQKQADTALSGYKTARQKIVNVHMSTVQSLQSKIDADVQLLATLRAGTSTPQILAQIQTVSDDWSSLKQQLVNENASYAAQLNNADRNIKNAEAWQKAVETQDKTLLDNVATVTGTVSVQWISFWDITRLYLPGYWIPIIFAALAFLSFLWDRRRFGTV
ncbi:MAG: hypothetical protein A3H71_00900 [Candidatus Sungbacteria bacterium RIFCSPLOWO2_02_FULL_48_13b]|uniref:DUF4349 domain-containing protein n=1 Tax=Candidatus Sungbacteria bacterium RIFCSPLOWO2_02_FULL_48_13b TaxID=1802283 RepID=A0A1G2LFC9_9BACT|nr:MAG: hypothetical protein A3H71_00900 [Candidatus Sungbacteria bacterium RIFCSPLOWO2_02_FULL_48_13b]